MILFIRTHVILILLLLVSSCGFSERELDAYRNAYSLCQASIKMLDLYEKDGTHITKTKDAEDFSLTICMARSKLYVEGFRISPMAVPNDWGVYQNYLINGQSVYNIYREAIKKGVEP